MEVINEFKIRNAIKQIVELLDEILEASEINREYVRKVGKLRSFCDLVHTEITQCIYSLDEYLKTEVLRGFIESLTELVETCRKFSRKYFTDVTIYNQETFPRDDFVEYFKIFNNFKEKFMNYLDKSVKIYNELLKCYNEEKAKAIQQRIKELKQLLTEML